MEEIADNGSLDARQGLVTEKGRIKVYRGKLWTYLRIWRTVERRSGKEARNRSAW